MAERPRGPRRPGADAPKAGGGRKPAAFGDRAGRGPRPAGKPAKGPARPRSTGGMDPKTLDVLEREGLLTAEGHRLRTQDPSRPAPEGGRGKPARPAGAAPRPAGAAPRPAGAAPRPAGAAPRPAGAAPRPAGPTAPRTAAPGLGGPTPVAGARPARARLTDAESTVAQRLHKVMAQAGVASRRHSEELIQAGRVTVNGKVVSELGVKVVPGKDLVEVDGRSLGRPESFVYVLMNKPKGYVTTMYDPQGRPKVLDLLEGGVGERVYPVGRLDYDTEGLLVLTNDGELANALMHPARKVKKTYIAKLRGVPGPAKLAALEKGIELDDGVTAPAEVKLLEVKAPNAATVSLRIHEGRNRQVRRMFEALGHEVIHLKRTTLGPLTLGELQPGQWRDLEPSEVSDLRMSVGLRTGASPGKPEAQTDGPRVRGTTVVRRRPGTPGTDRPGTRPGTPGTDRPGGRPGGKSPRVGDRRERPERSAPRGREEAAQNLGGPVPRSGSSAPARSPRPGSGAGGRVSARPRPTTGSGAGRSPDRKNRPSK